jgi:hypothetical protein
MTISSKPLQKQTSLYFVDEVLSIYPEYNDREYNHHDVALAREVFPGVTFIKNVIPVLEM